MCTCFWNLKGTTKASLLIPWQRNAWMQKRAPPQKKKVPKVEDSTSVSGKIPLKNLYVNYLV